MTAAPTRTARSLPAIVWGRFKRHCVLKFIGLTLFITVFFMAYFHLLRHPAFPVTVMPTTWLDELIPFQPWSLLFYLSLWFYVSVPAHLTCTLRQLVAFGALCFLLCLTGLLCFYFWPTAVPPADADWASYPAFAFLQRVDAGGNACPSLHVATAVFSGVWIDRLLCHLRTHRNLRIGNALWCAAIVYSTLATRQHVALDALAGAALGGIFAMASRPLGPWLLAEEPR
ncbi:phosphatase PAP2 family protein [Viridibacterium curvum]